jgi:hypothetical protein
VTSEGDVYGNASGEADTEVEDTMVRWWMRRRGGGWRDRKVIGDILIAERF